MPRPIVLGNGSLLVGIDAEYAVRDLFWPRVGHPNHLNGHKIRMGLWVDGRFAWCDGPGWDRTLAYKPRSLVGHCRLRHKGLGIELTCEDAVDIAHPVWVRRITMRNLGERMAEVRLFFTHDLRIDEADVGDTALYIPQLDGVVHYKGHRWFLFGGTAGGREVQEYATGIKAFGGLEGTWRDAEDGSLSNNPIAQGSVDSTMSLWTRLEPMGEEVAFYWMAAAESLEGVSAMREYILKAGPDAVISSVESENRAWLDRACVAGIDSLSLREQDLFWQSLLIMRTQIDAGGAIMAANDTDIMETNRATYSYTWPRDGACVGMMFDKLGYPEVARGYIQFCQRLFSPDRPYLLQKYRSDGSLGATWHPWVVEGRPEVPFQQDETALTLTAIADYCERNRDLELLQQLWPDMVRPAADFICKHVDPETGLPLPSWDLWEERRGVHTWTVVSVIQCLRACSVAAATVGDADRLVQYLQVAETMRGALMERLFDSRTGCFLRRLDLRPDGTTQIDPIVDSSVLSVVLFGVLPPEDPMACSTLAVIEEKLGVRSPIGGLARYQGDYYFRRSDHYPGNPWIICTMWLAQVKLASATTLEDLKEPRRWLQWACDRATTSLVLAEQVHPDSGEPLSVSPLTWSHAEYVRTVLMYLEASDRVGA